MQAEEENVNSALDKGDKTECLFTQEDKLYAGPRKCPRAPMCAEMPPNRGPMVTREAAQ